jgi:hypothetical protein
MLISYHHALMAAKERATHAEGEALELLLADLRQMTRLQ